MAQIQNPTAFLFRWNGRTKAPQGAQIAYFHYTTDAQGVEIPGSAFESAPQAVSVAGSAGVPLADIVGLINAGSLAAAADLAVAQAQIASDATLIADLRAQIAALTPPPADLIGQKFIATALAKLSLADVWQKAIELAVQALADAKDPDPKRVYSWWLKVDQISRTEPEWLLIVAQMDKAAMWGKSSQVEMIDLARLIQADAQGSVADAAAVEG